MLRTWDNLNKHFKSHKKGNWFYCDFCSYKNNDKCSTESHMYTHVKGNEQYVCTKYTKRFRFSTQFKWYNEQGCKVLVAKAQWSLTYHVL